MKKLIACAMMIAAVSILAGCQKKELLPQPEFPLSEAELTAALDEIGLPWSIEETHENSDGKDVGITYLLHRPEHRGGHICVVTINSYDTEEFGRKLGVDFIKPQKKPWYREDIRWEDWRELMALTARLYGGFEDAEEIYRACSAVELPQDAINLWEGTLTGGYCRIGISEKIESWRPSNRGLILSLDIYESEAYYLAFVKKAKKITEKWASENETRRKKSEEQASK